MMMVMDSVRKLYHVHVSYRQYKKVSLLANI